MAQDTDIIQIKEQVWRGIYETERVMRYYQKLSDRMQILHDLLTWLTVICAAMAIIPLVINLPTLISVGFFGAVAVSTLWSIHAKYASKATATRFFAERYGDLAIQWRELWYGETDQSAISALWRQYDTIPNGYEIGVNEGLNDKAQREAYKVIPLQFRAGSGSQGLTSSSATS